MVEICGYDILPGQVIVYKKKGSRRLEEIYVQGFRKDHGQDIIDVQHLNPQFLPGVRSWIFPDEIYKVVVVEAEKVPLEAMNALNNGLVLDRLISEHAPK